MGYPLLRNLTQVFDLRKMSRRSGRALKSFLNALGSILAKYQPKRSHGDPKRISFYINIMLQQETCVVLQQEKCVALQQETCVVLQQQTCCFATTDMCCVATRAMCSVAARDICSVATRDMCYVATREIILLPQSTCPLLRQNKKLFLFPI